MIGDKGGVTFKRHAVKMDTKESEDNAFLGGALVT